ncbi:MAG: hypothetical protein R2722_01895 [Tessaracoccus sp.]
MNHHDDLTAQVLAVAPDGVDWLFTAHSEGQIETYAQILRPFGHIVAIDDGPRDVFPLKGKSIAWHWELMFTRPIQETPDMIEQHRLLNTVADLIDEDRIHTTATMTLTRSHRKGSAKRTRRSRAAARPARSSSTDGSRLKPNKTADQDGTTSGPPRLPSSV